MTRDERLMLAEQGADVPEMAGCDVHRPASVSPAEAMREAAARVCEGLPARAYPANFAGCNPANVAGYCAEAIRAIPLPADQRDAEIERLTNALQRLVAAKALAGVRALVAGWNGENLPDGPHGERHPSQLGATLPKTNCGAVYELDEAMVAARAALAQSGGAK